MRQTKKYTAACEILTYTHSTQEQLERLLQGFCFWCDTPTVALMLDCPKCGKPWDI